MAIDAVSVAGRIHFRQESVVVDRNALMNADNAVIPHTRRVHWIDVHNCIESDFHKLAYKDMDVHAVLVSVVCNIGRCRRIFAR